MKNKTFYLTIDPGINGTGYAVWSRKWKLVTTGVISEPRVDKWYLKGKAIACGLWKTQKKYDVKRVYIEMPAFFQSAGGQVTAKSGALVKLSWFVGYLSAVLIGKEIQYVTVSEWKGQLPKAVVEKRINKIYPKNNFKSHSYDSVGIGLFIAGRF